MKFSLPFLISTASVFLLCTFYAHGQTVVGSANIPLTGPVTKEITEQAREIAADALRKEIYIWLKENMATDLDTTNTLKSHILDKFSEHCLSQTTEESAFKARVWSFSYIITHEKIMSAVSSHNSQFDSNAQFQWNRHLSALEQTDFPIALSSGVQALACASAFLGAQNQLSDATAKNLKDEIRTGVQSFFDRMVVQSSEMVIDGKPGSLPTRFPTVTIKVGDTPLLGMGFTSFVQNGRKVFQILTDDDGSFSLGKHKVPFVHNGSFLTLVPEASFYLDAGSMIRLKDMGIQMNRGQDLSFIYKVPTLTYSLDHKVHSPKDAVALPKDFLADSHIRKYLKDSCNLQPAPAGAVPELVIRINAEISRPSYEQTGEASVMLVSRVEIKGNKIGGSEDLIYEQRHEKGVDIPLGVFFWEAAGRLRSTLRQVLNQL